MKNIVALLVKARTSKWSLRKLNGILSLGIPFNRPHGIKIVTVDKLGMTCFIPYKRANFNHIRGIHACGIATVGEFAGGLTLMMKFVPKHYRLIMSKLQVTYHYQAKMDLFARAEIKPESVEQLTETLAHEASTYQLMITEIHDVEGNHVATVSTTWQIKSWDKVRLKVK